MRINKYLALCGVASRRKSESFVTEGKVSVNGKVVTDLTTTVNVKKDKVMLEGELVSLPSNYVYYKLNKPKGYICSATDDRGRKTIYELIKSDNRLFSIGRLDYDTEGL
ncbi:MAG: rRNA pseudouridine synthase, partial [Clostridia bacterium]|nr:rRNA pseudouridine synthase [Clostridia bacterium]